MRRSARFRCWARTMATSVAFKSAKPGRISPFRSSNLANATRVCDRLDAIDRGEIIFHGHPNEVFQNEEVIKTVRG